jgi:hypothetical protein
VRFGGTHGALDDLNSNGILVSSFAPTRDTSANRVAALFDGFKGVRDYRAGESGAEWVSGKAQALTAIARAPLDGGHELLASDEILLRIWTPSFIQLGTTAPVDLTLKKAPHFQHAEVRRGDPKPIDTSEQRLTLNRPLAFPDGCSFERVYALPARLNLEPGEAYLISGQIRAGRQGHKIFSFTFRTDQHGMPAAY